MDPTFKAIAATIENSNATPLATKEEVIIAGVCAFFAFSIFQAQIDNMKCAWGERKKARILRNERNIKLIDKQLILSIPLTLICFATTAKIIAIFNSQLTSYFELKI